MTERARNLRKNGTDAEARLWSKLRAQQLGVKFRRQHPVDGFIADFACIEHRLIVELDGGQHLDQQEYDQRRTAALESLGFRVLRFWNDDALLRTDDVLESIHRALAEPPPPHPDPLPPLRRGRGGRAKKSPLLTAQRAKTAPQAKSPLPRAQPGGDVDGATTAPGAKSPLPQAQPGGEGWVRGRGSKDTTNRPLAQQRTEATPPTASAFQARARLYRLIREFMAERDVLEVETPILSAAGNTEPNIESFSTSFTGHFTAGPRERFLRTSPEYPLKRLLAAGVGDCYELGRVFRNGEAGSKHNPEFSMLEWYRLGFDHLHMANETAQLVQAAHGVFEQTADIVQCSYREWFHDGLGLDPFHASMADLQAPLAEFRIDPAELERDDWLDLLITHCLQARFPLNQITIVYDYPASQCSLARVRDGSPRVAERFELYLGPVELANGYNELNDASEQRQRFEADNARRASRGQRELPIDENLLMALDSLPPCAGVALGIDRLLMCLLGSDDIADVLAFSFAQA